MAAAQKRAEASLRLTETVERMRKVAESQGISIPMFDGSNPVDEWQRIVTEAITLAGHGDLIADGLVARRIYEAFVTVSMKQRLLLKSQVDSKVKKLYNGGACSADEYLKALTEIQHRPTTKTLGEISQEYMAIGHMDLDMAMPILDRFANDMDLFVRDFKKDQCFVDAFRTRVCGESMREHFDTFCASKYSKDVAEGNLTKVHVMEFVQYRAKMKSETARAKEAPKPSSVVVSKSPVKSKEKSSAPTSPQTSPKKEKEKEKERPSDRTRTKVWKPGMSWSGGTCYACAYATTKGKAMHEDGKHPAGSHCPHYEDWKKSKQTEKSASAMVANITDGVFIAGMVSTDTEQFMQPVFLDTGAGPNMISAGFVDAHHLPTRQERPITLAGLSTVVTSRVADLEIILCKQARHMTFYVVPELPTPVVVGQRYMRANAIDIYNSKSTVTIGAEGSVPFVPPVASESDLKDDLVTALIGLEVEGPHVMELPLEEARDNLSGKGLLAKDLLELMRKKGHNPESIAASLSRTAPVEPAMVAPATAPSLDFSKAKINPDLPEKDREKIAEVLKSRPDAWFDPDAPESLGKAEGVSFTIPMDEEVERRPPVLPRGFRYSPADWALISAWLRESLRIGRVERAQVAQFLNRLVVVRTRDEDGNVKIRYCLDLRTVNSYTTKQPYRSAIPSSCSRSWRVIRCSALSISA